MTLLFVYLLGICLLRFFVLLFVVFVFFDFGYVYVGWFPLPYICRLLVVCFVLLLVCGYYLSSVWVSCLLNAYLSCLLLFVTCFALLV